MADTPKRPRKRKSTPTLDLDDDTAAPSGAAPSPAPAESATAESTVNAYSVFSGRPTDAAPPPSAPPPATPMEADPAEDAHPYEPAPPPPADGFKVEFEAPPAAPAGAAGASPPADPPKRKRKKDDTNSFEEYVDLASNGTQLADLLSGYLTKKKLEPHVLAGTIHHSHVETIIRSLDLTDRERAKLSTVAAKYMEKAEIYIPPEHQVLVLAAAIYAPRAEYVMSLDLSLKRMAQQGMAINETDVLLNGGFKSKL